MKKFYKFLESVTEKERKEKMKVLLINGSPRKEGNTYLALREMEKIFEQEQVESEIIHIGNKIEDVFKVFPDKTANMYLPFNSTEETLMKDWCNRFGYTMHRIREHVYLNNDGNTPVELRVNGVHVNFPDQQPTIVPPGRTMIPVAFVAEALGWTVDWDAQNQRVIIMKGGNTMILWFGSDKYWFNNYYYQMDVKVYTERDRTMVPIAFIAQAFNQKLNFWMEDGVFIVDLSSGR